MKENKLILVVLLVIFKFIDEMFTREFELGPCYLQFLEPCANNSIQFFLFTSDKAQDEPVLLDNISPSLQLDYNETISKTFKMIIHGYGGHLDFNGSREVRNGKSFISYSAQENCICRYFCIGQTCISCETFWDTDLSFKSFIFSFLVAPHATLWSERARVASAATATMTELVIINLLDYSL